METGTGDLGQCPDVLECNGTPRRRGASQKRERASRSRWLPVLKDRADFDPATAFAVFDAQLRLFVKTVVAPAVHELHEEPWATISLSAD